MATEIEESQIRLLSNLPNLTKSDEHFAKIIINHPLPYFPSSLSGWLRRIAATFKLRNFDAALLSCAPAETLAYAAILRFLPFMPWKLLVFDPVYLPPRNLQQKVVAFIKKIILSRVDLFMLVQRDYDGYAQVYGVNAARVKYIPWKVNRLDLIEQLAVHEGDYIFSGGLTMRDWQTLAVATRRTGIPMVVSMPSDEVIKDQGLPPISSPMIAAFNSHTSLIRHGPDPLDWLRLVADSKFVVIPICREALNPAGISTALACMALKKCVIMSAGPSTNGILDNSNCMIVPPGDSEALKNTIEIVNSDDQLRNRVAAAGYEFAKTCGDEKRLYRDLCATVVDTFKTTI